MRLYKKCSLILCTALLLVNAAYVHAAGITVAHAELVAVDEVYHLNADFEISFSHELEEAINKGIALNFLIEFVLMEPHKYWMDEEATSTSMGAKLAYHALSRQYLLTLGKHQASYVTLAEALEALSKLRGLPVVEKSALKKETNYYALLRLRLDQTRLPKPLQVSAIGSDGWNLVSDRFRWSPNFDKPGLDKSSLDKSSLDKSSLDKSNLDKLEKQ
ncbi:MAG: DUF4390 domain-containing protein [Methylophilaceae bacterium]